MLIEFVRHGLVAHDQRLEPMDGAWAFVVRVGNGIELLLAVDGLVGTFGWVFDPEISFQV